MILRLLYRILFVAVIITSMEGIVMAQESYDEYDVVAIKGIKRIYSLPANDDVSFFWSYKDIDGAIIPLENNSNKIEYAFTEEGEYVLSVYGKDKESGCFSESTEIKIKVLEAGFDVELGVDKWICSGDTIELVAQVKEKHIDGKYEELTYEWDGVSGTTSKVKVSESGTYQVKVTDKYGNSVYDVVNIDVYPSPIINLGEDIILDKGKSVVLSTHEAFDKYEWSTGDTEEEIEVNLHGKYSLTVTDVNKCVASDTIRIFYKGETTPSGLVASLPSAFSPNNDGVNDKLFVRGDLSRVKKLTFVIYRRDGLKVFETTNINEGWDGKYKGEELEINGFVYLLKVVFDTEEVLTKKGSISLLR